MDPSIRQATEADWTALKAIRLQALQDAPLAFGSTYAREVAFDDHQWRDRIADAPQFLAFLGDALVGMATSFPDPDDPGRVLLFGMFVDPAARGRGIAGSLLEAVIDDARNRDKLRVALHVVEDNLVARDLYQRRGFAPTGHRAGLPHTPEVAEIELEFELSTDPRR